AGSRVGALVRSTSRSAPASDPPTALTSIAQLSCTAPPASRAAPRISSRWAPLSRRRNADSRSSDAGSSSCTSGRARALAQHEFLDLSGRGLRQRTEHHLLRHLETREVLAAPGNDLGGLETGAGFQG